MPLIDVNKYRNIISVFFGTLGESFCFWEDQEMNLFFIVSKYFIPNSLEKTLTALTVLPYLQEKVRALNSCSIS